MKLSNFIDGLNTLHPYFDDPDGYHIGAEHDQFYVYQTNKPLSDADVKKMQALGWFQPEVDYDGGENSTPAYDPEDGWSAFT